MKTKKILKRSLEYGLIRSSMTLAQILPRDKGMDLFSAMGSASSSIFRSSMERAMRNLSIAFPQTPALVRRSMARAMFKEMGKNCFDFINLENASPRRIQGLVSRVDGMERFEAAYGGGRGVISVTGHIGCWELMAAYMASRGYPVTVVAKRLWMERLNRKVIGMRKSFGVETVDRDENPRLMLEVLQRGEVLGMLMDQQTNVSGLYVPFFDKPAHTPSGAAKLASITGAILVPMAIYLNRDRKHEIKILEPIDPAQIRGSRAERIERITRTCSQAIEQLIRFDPKQWVWFHNRWNEREGRNTRYATIW